MLVYGFQLSLNAVKEEELRILIQFIFQERISGYIFVQSNSDIKHDGISLTMEGTVNLQLSAKNVGIFEAFYNSVKVCIIDKGSLREG